MAYSIGDVGNAEVLVLDVPQYVGGGGRREVDAMVHLVQDRVEDLLLRVLTADTDTSLQWKICCCVS